LTPHGLTEIEILTIFKHAVVISFFMFVMMLPVDFFDTVNQTRMSDLIRGGRWREVYIGRLSRG
jgi:hypothetical protein